MYALGPTQIQLFRKNVLYHWTVATEDKHARRTKKQKLIESIAKKPRDPYRLEKRTNKIEKKKKEKKLKTK